MDEEQAALRAAMPSFQDPEIYRNILDELQIGVSVLDLNKKIVFWSDGAEEITGYSRLEVLGHCCTDNILQHCDQNCCEMCAEKCPIITALHGGKPHETISFIHHKSGHRTPVHLWSIPLRDQHGLIIGVIQSFEGEATLVSPNPSDQQLKDHGWLDVLTGLPNQVMMHSHLRESLGTFADLQVPFAVACVEFQDLDGFRARYGKEASVAMIKVLARTLRNGVWPTDFVGRWSESQFQVILSGCGKQALPAVTARMQRLLSNANIVWWGEELGLKTSIGCCEALQGDTVESIVKRAQQDLKGAENSQPSAARAKAAASPKV